MKQLIFLTTFFITTGIYAQHPWLIKDINATGTQSGTVYSNRSDAGGSSDIYQLNGIAYFVATDGVNGYELWRSDGTNAGTYMVKDITAGGSSTTFLAFGFYVSNSLIYFITQSSAGYNSLWRTDGTSSGTYTLLTGNANFSIPSNIGIQYNYGKATELNGSFYILVNETNIGTNTGACGTYTINRDRIYKTDGTVAGTSLYFESANNPYYGNSTSATCFFGNLSNIYSSGGKLYIVGAASYAGNGSTKPYLLSSDGSAAPTAIYNPGGINGVSINEAVNVNDNYLLIFGRMGSDASSVYRLKNNETTPVLIYTGSAASYTGCVASNNASNVIGNKCFFTAGGKPLVTDGTVAGTYLSTASVSTTCFIGIVNNNIVISDNGGSVYSWDGNSASSAVIISDSLNGKSIYKAFQSGNRAYYLSPSTGYPRNFSADLNGSNCLNMYPSAFSSSGTLLSNGYWINFSGNAGSGGDIAGNYYAGIEPFAYNTNIKYFSGVTSNDWNTATNWIPNGVPTASDEVMIPPLPTAKHPVINTNSFCKNLLIYGASLTINSGFNLDVNGYVANYVGVIQGAGSLSLKSSTKNYLYGSGSGYNWSTAVSVTGNYINVNTINISNSDVYFSSSDVTLNSVVNIQTDNKILAPYTSLTFNKKPYISGYNSNRYIVTNNSKTVTFAGVGSSTTTDSTFTFPIGSTTSSYTPASFVYKLDNGPSFALGLADSVNANGSSGTLLTSRLVNKKWIFINGYPNISKITLGWGAADETTNFDRTQAFISTYNSAYNGNYWTVNSGQAATISGTQYSISLTNPASNLNQMIVTDTAGIAKITTASGNWSSGSTWVGGVIPTSADQTFVKHAVTVAATSSALALNVLTNQTLTINNGQTLNVSNYVNNNGTIAGSGTLLLNATTTQNITGTGTINNLTLNITGGGGANINSGSSQSITGVITPTNGSLTNNGTLTLKSTTSGTANIGAFASGGYYGTLTIERYLSGKRAYRFLSHPFSYVALSQLTPAIDITGAGGNTNGFTPTSTNAPSAFWYDATVGNSSTSPDPGWTAFTNTTNTGTWGQYKGIRLLIRGAKGEGLTGGIYTPSATTISMNGYVNYGNQTITITKGTNTNYNLVGNPYPSPVDLSLTTRGSNIGANFYVWDATAAGTNGRGAYISQPFSSSYILPINAAFFVTTSANTNNTIQFTESMKSTSTPVSLFGTGNSYFGTNSLQLRLEQNGDFYDRLLLFFDKPNSSINADWYDAEKMVNPDANLSTISADNKQLSIDARPYSTTAIPLYLNISNNITGVQNFSIAVPDFDVSNNRSLFLHDKLKNTFTALTRNINYDFEVSSNDSATQYNRFELTATKPLTALLADNNNTVSITAGNQQFIVQYNNQQPVNTAVKLTAIDGKVLQLVNLGIQKNGKTTIGNAQLPQGVYVIEVMAGENKTVKQVMKQ